MKTNKFKIHHQCHTWQNCDSQVMSQNAIGQSSDAILYNEISQ